MGEVRSPVSDHTPESLLPRREPENLSTQAARWGRQCQLSRDRWSGYSTFAVCLRQVAKV